MAKRQSTSCQILRNCNTTTNAFTQDTKMCEGRGELRDRDVEKLLAALPSADSVDSVESSCISESSSNYGRCDVSEQKHQVSSLGDKIESLRNQINGKDHKVVSLKRLICDLQARRKDEEQAVQTLLTEENCLKKEINELQRSFVQLMTKQSAQEECMNRNREHKVRLECDKRHISALIESQGQKDHELTLEYKAAIKELEYEDDEVKRNTDDVLDKLKKLGCRKEAGEAAIAKLECEAAERRQQLKEAHKIHENLVLKRSKHENRVDLLRSKSIELEERETSRMTDLDLLQRQLDCLVEQLHLGSCDVSILREQLEYILKLRVEVTGRLCGLKRRDGIQTQDDVVLEAETQAIVSRKDHLNGILKEEEEEGNKLQRRICGANDELANLNKKYMRQTKVVEAACSNCKA